MCVAVTVPGLDWTRSRMGYARVGITRRSSAATARFVAITSECGNDEVAANLAERLAVIGVSHAPAISAAGAYADDHVAIFAPTKHELRRPIGA
jgi:hypothetical protein